MRWLEMLRLLVGPVIAAVRAVAGDDWDPAKAEAVTRALVRNPPRQAISDDKRAELEAIAEGES